MHQKAILKISVTGHVEFEWISLHQMPVHDDADAIIVPWRNNAYEQHPQLFHLTSRGCRCYKASEKMKAQPKCITVKHVPHPVDVVPRVIALSLHVAGTKSMDVIELNQAQFFRKKFAPELYGRGNDRLLA